MLPDADKSLRRQRRCIIWKMVGSEAGEHTEGKIKRPDEETSRQTEQTGWDTKVGDQPECVRLDLWANVRGESIDFSLGQAIEKKVCHDQIAFLCGDISKRAHLVRSKAVGLPATTAKEPEHPSTGIDRIRPQVRVDRQ